MKFLQDNGSMCFDSVADMVASNLESGHTVITKGYYSANDGGSALYTIRAKDVADVDDGGSIIFLDNDNVAELIADGTVNVKQFGAKGDGVADDTDAIKNAIAYIPSEPLEDTTWYTLYIPFGNYLITDTITVGKNCNIVFDGNIIYGGDRDKPAILLNGLTNCNITIGTVVDVAASSAVQYNGGWHGWSDENYIGVDTKNLKNCKIFIKDIIDFTVGFRCHATNGNGWWQNNTTIKRFSNCKIGLLLDSDGANADNTQGSWINANVFYDICGATTSSIAGFVDYAGTVYTIKQVLTNGNKYGGNSNVFNNTMIEFRNDNAFVGVHLEFAQEWVFDKLRIELPKATSIPVEVNCANFTDVNTKSSHTNRIKISNITGLAPAYGKIVRYYGFERVYTCLDQIAQVEDGNVRTSKLQGYKTLIDWQEKDLKNSTVNLNGTYYSAKFYRFALIGSTSNISSVLSDYRGYTSGIPSEHGITSASATPISLYVPVQQFKTYRIKVTCTNPIIRLKTYDSNGNIITHTNSSYDTGLACEPSCYYGTAYNTIQSAVTTSQVTVSVVDSNIKYLLFMIVGTDISNITIDTDDADAMAITHYDTDTYFGYFLAPSVPTVTTGTMIGTIVYKNSDPTTYYVLEKTGGVVGWATY